MKQRTGLHFMFLALAGPLLACQAVCAQGNASVEFVMHRVGSFRSEAIGVADFNGDGKLDIVAGAYVYLAPNWKAVKIRSFPRKINGEGKGYIDDFMNLPLDVDEDGKIDVVSCGWFCKCVRWHKNTLGEGDSEWPETIADESGNYESGDLRDVDGDGKAREILAHTAATVWYEAAKLPSGESGLTKHLVSDEEMSYGGGVGDVNGDGRPDILRPNAWFQAPADPREGEWKKHPWSLGAKDGGTDHTPQILVQDVNQDKRPDVITSNAHKHGIFWYEQLENDGEVTWKQHTIDDTWSQAHSLALADVNGDGNDDFVTGKRFFAHNGNDPDAHGELGVYWYELHPGPKPKWTRHAISHGEGIGSGVNLCAVDLDEDGDVDILVTGKWGGPIWFENKRN